MKKFVFVFMMLSATISYAQDQYEPYDRDYQREDTQDNTSDYDDLIQPSDRQQVPAALPEDSALQGTQAQQPVPQNLRQADIEQYRMQVESLATELNNLKEAVQILKTAQSAEISQIKDDIQSTESARKKQISGLKEEIQSLTARIGELINKTEIQAKKTVKTGAPLPAPVEADNEHKAKTAWKQYLPEFENQLDLSLLILNLILTGMGILIAVLILFNIFSFFKFKKINKYIRKSRNDAHVIRKLQEKAQDDKNKSRPDDIPIRQDKELSPTQRRRLDEFVMKVNLNEMLGNELSAEDYIAVAKYYYFREMMSDALEYLDKGLKKNPKLAKAWVLKGFLFWQGKMYDEALKAYDKAIRLNPRDGEAWCNKGNTLSDLNKHKDALAAFDKALKINPKFAEAWYNKGNVYFEMKKYGEAVEAWDKAIQINPASEDAWYNKSCAYAVLNDRINTLECLREAVRINPANAKSALEDEDFRWLRDDSEFRKIVGA